MDEAHLLAALRYVALNPVRARLATRAQEWRWSSVHALLDPQTGDGLTETGPVLARVPDFAELLRSGDEHEALTMALRRSESTGRPLGDNVFSGTHRRRAGMQPKANKARAKSEGGLSAASP